MKNTVGRKPFLIFNVLVIYVLVQLVWWAWLIISLLHTVYGEGSEYESKFRMILGEGLVFVVLLIVGIFITSRMFRKELLLNHQQQNFLLSVTHELKTPLASNRLALETLENRDLDYEKRKEIIKKALDENIRLSNLIENILLSASLDSPNFNIYKEEENISKVIQQTVSSLQYTVGKYHETVLEIQEGVKLRVDKTLFPSIISNLYENATKYSAASSKIIVQLLRVGDHYELIVIDSGIGIDENNKNAIFKKFFRIQDENTRTVKGTGLGLYLTKIICDYHQFEILVEKNNPKGSVFRVILK